MGVSYERGTPVGEDHELDTAGYQPHSVDYASFGTPILEGGNDQLCTTRGSKVDCVQAS